MNAEQRKEKWMTFTGDLKLQYGKCTDDDWRQIERQDNENVAKFRNRIARNKFELMRVGGPVAPAGGAGRYKEKDALTEVLKKRDRSLSNFTF